ncbi:FxSxx-COOH system tetratricopeptide repeat protein [Kitasatospora sp. NPDC088391]|uniref:FxSxx-COOH system tetratricopeptide repeat protein n=1 Tax=Kitasatospora sp. NPDC088391 TaxID=3364074 RepID=UPI00381714FE
MTDTLARLLAAAHALDGDAFDAELLADAAWLAAARAGASGGPDGTVPGRDRTPPVPRRPADRPDPPPDPGHGPAAPERTAPVSASRPGGGTPVRGVPLSLRRPGALPDAPALGRALRSFRRPWRGGPRVVLDVEATADGYARGGSLLPVLVPAPERWFDVVLVVDTALTMAPWAGLARSVGRLLEDLGAFRSVRTWHLGWDGDEPRLRDHRDRPVPGRRAPQHSGNPVGRRLFLVITDCAAPGWRCPEPWLLLRHWARSCQTALLNPLPRRLWHRSALDQPAGRSVSPAPAAPGRTPQDRRRPDSGAPFALPVLTCTAPALRSWARAVMRADPAGCAAVLVPAEGRAVRTAGPAAGPADLADAFLASAPPGAVRLALLAAVLDGFTVPVLEVLRAHLPGSGPSDLAEVLCSGLLTVARPASGEAVLRYEPAARARLAEGLTRRHARLVHEAMSAHLAAHPHGPHGIGAVVADPEADQDVPADLTPFAEAGAATLALLGIGAGRASAPPPSPPSAPPPPSVPSPSPSRTTGSAPGPGPGPRRLPRGVPDAPRAPLRPVRRPEASASDLVIDRSTPLSIVVGAQAAAPIPQSPHPVAFAAADQVSVNLHGAAPAVPQDPHDPASPPRHNLPPVGRCHGREDELALIHGLLNDRASDPRRTVVLQGIGGAGKSTLAATYAHRHLDGYRLVWWVGADSAARIEQSLADLARSLDPALAQHLSGAELAERATDWLASHGDWLLVLDDVDAPEDLLPHLAALRSGHVLATSRRQDGWPYRAETLRLGSFTPDDSTALLWSLAFGDAPPRDADLDRVRLLAEDLGHLPLAVVHAGAFLRQNPDVTVEDYRARLATVLNTAPEGFDSEQTISRIWTRTLRVLTEQDASTVALLHTLAWLAPERVPLTLLEAPDGSGHPDGPDERLRAALSLLASYSLVTLSTQHVGVHRLLQTVLRNTAPAAPDGTPAGRRTAERLLTAALLAPADDSADPSSRWEALLPHVMALAAGSPPGHDDADAVPLYRAAARHLSAQGHAARAVPLLELVLGTLERAPSAARLDTVDARSELAASYWEAGRAAEAADLLEQVLADRQRLLGPDHPDTLTSRHNLAVSYQQVGRLSEAIDLLEQVLADRERVLGPDHPGALTSRHNLAVSYQQVGRLSEAVELLEQVLADRQRLLGPDHPDTLTSRHNLAVSYQQVGRLSEAVDLLEQVLADRERVLGPDHPGALTTRSNLATVHSDLGDLTQATTLLRTVLTDSQRLLGPDHPDTLTSRNNLAFVLHRNGDLPQATALFEGVVADSDRVLGPNHPDTLATRSNLAAAYRDLGDLTRATALFEGVLADRERVLGPNHPDTLATRSNLATVYRDLGDLTRATALFEGVLADRERVLGPEHPDTLRSSFALALALLEAGDSARGLALLEDVHRRRRVLLGEDHPQTRAALDALAAARGSASGS